MPDRNRKVAIKLTRLMIDQLSTLIRRPQLEEEHLTAIVA